MKLIAALLLMVVVQQTAETDFSDKDMTYEEPLPELTDEPFEGVLHYMAGYVADTNFDGTDLSEVTINGTVTIYVKDNMDYTITNYNIKTRRPFYSEHWFLPTRYEDCYHVAGEDTLYCTDYDPEMYKPENYRASAPKRSKVRKFGQKCFYQVDTIEYKGKGPFITGHYYHPSIGIIDTTTWELADSGIKDQPFMTRGAYDCIRISYMPQGAMVRCLYKVEPKKLPDSLFTSPTDLPIKMEE